MKLGRTLQPGDRVARYRVVGPLGAGGMGEVYLAQDESLERTVALKILPPELVRSEERLRRFVLEAKSASSLNHPNIVTIYEIGQDVLRTGDGSESPAGATALHYISMERVVGKTLTSLIHEEKADLRTLLGYLAQVAEGLAKAHGAGIVHRDLKPGNIMVSADGFAKVLDFGLAKLTEKRTADPEVSAATTLIDQRTSEGMVVGTVGYMSPEQVQGKPVDHRSDIFSFGSILYEATTGQRPFAAESSVETMHKILAEKPAPVEELNPKAPAELRRLIRRCLAKNPEQRLQSMKDIAIELREMVDEFDLLSASASSGTSTSAVAAVPAHRRSPALWIAVAAIVVGGGAVAGYLAIQRSRAEGPVAALRSAPPVTVTNRGDVSEAVISSDGRTIAYVSGPAGGRSVWVRQISTGSDVQILPGQTTEPFGLTFSPDGDYVFYLNPDPDRSGYKALFQIPTMGGAARKRLYDIDCAVSFAPDGRRVCFWRGIPQEKRMALIVFDLSSEESRVLASVIEPKRFMTAPSWSPSGDRIALAVSSGASGGVLDLVTIRVRDGKMEPVRSGSLPLISGVAWMPHDRGLLVSALLLGPVPGLQLLHVSYPDGRTERVTNDVSVYTGASVSSDGRTVVTARGSAVQNLWLVDAAGGAPARQLTFASSPETSPLDFSPGGQDAIYYTHVSPDGIGVDVISVGSGTARPFVAGTGYVTEFRAVKGGLVFARATSKFTRTLWRLDAAANEPRRITTGTSDEFLRDVSPDGGTVLFNRSESPQELLRAGPDGGEPRVVVRDLQGGATLSPDGSRVLYNALRRVAGGLVFGLRAADLDGGNVDSLPRYPPRAADGKWGPDGRTVSFLNRADSTQDVWILPLGGGEPRRLTSFARGVTTLHRWSPDRSRLLLVRQDGRAVNLWVVGADGRGAKQLTQFQSGRIFEARWAEDGKSVAFLYGDQTADAVMLRATR